MVGDRVRHTLDAELSGGGDFSGMCYTSRDYKAEQEARKKREEARERQAAGKTGRDEKTEAPKKRDRELVRA